MRFKDYLAMEGTFELICVIQNSDNGEIGFNLD